MAKVNVKETAAEKIARLQAEINAAQAEVAAEETARIEKIASLIREFPAKLGVATMGDVINLCKQVEKGTLGKLDASASRSYKRLSDAEKATITERLKKGEQVSALAKEYGVSDGTVYGLKQDAGLTNKRTPAPVAAPAPAAV